MAAIPPVEVSPWIECGRWTPPAAGAAHTVEGVVRAVAGMPSAPVLIEHRCGLTAAGLELAEALARSGRSVTHLLSPFAAGDLVAVSDDHVGVEPRLGALLRRFAACGAIALRAELADAFLRSLHQPSRCFLALRSALDRLGVRVTAIAWSRYPEPADELASLLPFARDHGWADPLVRQYGLRATELRFGEPASAFEGLLEPVAIRARAASDGERIACTRLGIDLPRHYHVRRRTAQALVRSTPSGWETLPPDGPLAPLDAAPSQIGEIAIDPSHLAIGVQGDRSPVRPLPYPYRSYLAINSDIDWTTLAQHDAADRRIAGELGLPLSGSMYVAANRSASDGAHGQELALIAADGTVDRSIDARSSAGEFDTLHAVRDSIDVHECELRDGRWRSRYAARGPFRSILVWSASSVDPSTCMIEIGAERLMPAAVRGGATWAWIDCGEIGGADLDRLSITAPAHASRVELVSVGIGELEEDLRRAAGTGFRPSLFTTHGGGRAVKRFGNMRTAKVRAAAEAKGDEAQFDIDDPLSPVRLLDAFRAIGVRFFSPIGSASRPTLAPIDELVARDVAGDGSAIALVRRWHSRRAVEFGFPETFAFGKNAANPSSLQFQIEDFLLRSAWAGEGCGAVLYTHLGHNAGLQDVDRLGWSESTHAALERLAARTLGGERDGPVWVTATASLLRFAAVRARVASAIRRDGDWWIIEPWEDAAFGLTLPATRALGTRWLHGITLRVADARRTRVRAGDHEITSLAVNPPDRWGDASVTIVDDSATIELAMSAEGVATAPTDVDLRRVTHVSVPATAPLTVRLLDREGRVLRVGRGEPNAAGLAVMALAPPLGAARAGVPATGIRVTVDQAPATAAPVLRLHRTHHSSV